MEKDKLETTLLLLVEVLRKLKTEYRVFGSVIPAAILGRPQRKLGDVDLMLDIKDADRISQRLKNNGFKCNRKQLKMLGITMTWLEATSNNFYDLTAFLGKFDKDQNYIVNFSKNLRALVNYEAIRPTVYNYGHARFVGIPEKTAFYATWASRGNPKRKKDIEVFRSKKIDSVSINYPIMSFYYNDKKLPYVYPILCFLQDFLGRISLFIGRNYDFWKKNESLGELL